uniref:uncharacterized protein LOC120335707 isoform X1 n=2 Tax=Styela clava TaxID=7725 RepID=UPI001939E7C2|nr:uncharacterized protein LOC120335707 isoform X1 [Styela clava]
MDEYEYMADLRKFRHGIMGPSTRKIVISIMFGLIFYIVATNMLCPRNIEAKSLGAEECVEWMSSSEILDNNNLQHPQIKLNSERFLLPLLYNGPTNQIWGLRQAAYVAILLNRTLVLPLFHKHILDESGPGTIIDASHRFQVDSLSRLMSVVTVDKYHQHCGKNVDVVLQATTPRDWTVESLKQAEKELNLEFLQRSSKGIINRSGPFFPNIKVKAPFTAHADNSRIIRMAYKSDEKCAIYQFPFREIKMNVDHTPNQKENIGDVHLFSESTDDISSRALVNSLFQNMLPPKYIQEITETFLEHVFGGSPYLALHWRYDKEDFGKFMCNKEEGTGNQNQAEMCKKVNRILPKSLGRAMTEYISYVNGKSKSDVRHIYIATPKTQSTLHFLHDLTNELISKNLIVVTQVDLESFVEKSELITACSFLGENYNDFSALVEMEICTRSSVFLRSVYSSWSDNIVLNRDLANTDNALRRFDVAALKLPVLVN